MRQHSQTDIAGAEHRECLPVVVPVVSLSACPVVCSKYSGDGDCAKQELPVRVKVQEISTAARTLPSLPMKPLLTRLSQAPSLSPAASLPLSPSPNPVAVQLPRPFSFTPSPHTHKKTPRAQRFPPRFTFPSLSSQHAGRGCCLHTEMPERAPP